MSIPLCVSCEWLHERIRMGNLDNIVLLDVSWASTKDCFKEYQKCHIAGACHINIMCGENSDLYPRNIPYPEVFTKLAQDAGVSSNSHVIVYSNSDRGGYFLAGRGWWTLRYFGHKNVSILDGGLQKWLNCKFPTSSSEEDCQPGDFVAKVDKTIYKSYEEIKDNIESRKFQLIDTRASSAFKEKHIPGAKNLEMGKLIDAENGILKSEPELRQLFMEGGVDLNFPICTHCNSGMSSCTVAYVAVLLGAQEVSVYHGGFTEWSKRQDSE